MDHCSLVALFRRIISAAPPLLLGGCLITGCDRSYGHCPTTQTVTYPISQDDAGSADAGIDVLLARCQESSTDCMPLCEKVTPSVGLSPGEITSCGLVTSDYPMLLQGACISQIYPAIASRGERLEANLKFRLQQVSREFFEIRGR
jgi:hypothetical protein